MAVGSTEVEIQNPDSNAAGALRSFPRVRRLRFEVEEAAQVRPRGGGGMPPVACCVLPCAKCCHVPAPLLLSWVPFFRCPLRLTHHRHPCATLCHCFPALPPPPFPSAPPPPPLVIFPPHKHHFQLFLALFGPNA